MEKMKKYVKMPKRWFWPANRVRSSYLPFKIHNNSHSNRIPFCVGKNTGLNKSLSITTPFFFHLPFLVGILIFWTHHLGLTSKRATASYLYEGLVAAAITTLLIESNFLQALLLYTLPLAFMCVAYYHIVKTLWRRNNIPGSQVS